MTTPAQLPARRERPRVVQGRVQQSSYSTYNTRVRRPPRASTGAGGARAGAAAGPEGVAAGYAVGKASSAARGAARTAGQARIIPGDRAYQPVLLAEFLAAVVIVALVPMATGGSDTAKAKGGMSPYDTSDLTQLVAVGAVYFVLALASSGNSGRLSAWLGGLILLAIAMGKLAHGNLSAVFNFAKPGGGIAKYGKSADPFAQGDTGQ